MSDTVIEVENLSKKYIIGHQRQERYTAFRDVIAEKSTLLKSNAIALTLKLILQKREKWLKKQTSAVKD